MSRITAERYHDISAGHRVVDHEGACAHLHGHNYRFNFTCEATELDSVGRVIDFSVIKSTLCAWLDANWDHKFLVYNKDPWGPTLLELDKTVVVLDFNPTAENLAMNLVKYIGPALLADTGVTLTYCRVEETRKCSAAYYKERAIFAKI